MRVLHTSDWHLGRSFHGASLVAEQTAALGAMAALVRDQAVDVVVVAGDLYDRQLPPVDAVDLCSHALSELRGAGARVVAIAGNHDSARRLRFAEPLLSAAGVHIRTDAAACGTPVVVPATGGGPDLLVYPVPYLEPEVARHALGAPEIRGHDALLRLALDRARADLRRRTGRFRSLATAHAFVAGGAPCDSERVLAVGGADRVAASCFDGFDYVALGHLHGRQVLGEQGRIRYSGSPVPYSFSERDQVKGVCLVDLPDAGPVRVTDLQLPVGRCLATVRGTLDQLLRDRSLTASEGCWVQAVLTDQELPRDAMARLRARFPHAVTLLHEPPRPVGSGDGGYRARVRERHDLDLVADFVEHVTGRGLGAAERDDCAAALDVAVAG